MKKKKMMLLLVLLLAIGFAAVSANLVINGAIGISSKQSDFDVIFTNAILDDVENKGIIDNETKQTITFTSKELTTLNDTTTLEYEIVNESRLYDAKVNVTCNVVDNEGNETTNNYISIGRTPEEMIVSAGESGTGSITTTLIKTSTEEQDIKVKCTLNASAIERTSLGEEYIEPLVTFNANGGIIDQTSKIVTYGQTYGDLPTPTNNNPKAVFVGWYTEDGKRVVSTTTVEKKEEHILKASWYELVVDNNTQGVADVGDEIAIGEEHFYVISNENGTINALAKYNLNVGSNTVPNATYGIQNELAKGYVSSGTIYGTVKFSNNNGWPYENNETIDIKDYEGPVKEALYGTNGYEKHIQKTIPSATARLITKVELEGLGCNATEYTCTSSSYDWVYSIYYWTQSASSGYNNGVWLVRSVSYFDIGSFDVGDYYGVRPVITIPKN